MTSRSPEPMLPKKLSQATAYLNETLRYADSKKKDIN